MPKLTQVASDGSGVQIRIMYLLADLKAELRPTVRLAGPLVLAELGWMLMVIVEVRVRVESLVVGCMEEMVLPQEGMVVLVIVLWTSLSPVLLVV